MKGSGLSQAAPIDDEECEKTSGSLAPERRVLLQK
jgi:hypothetical protein